MWRMTSNRSIVLAALGRVVAQPDVHPRLPACLTTGDSPSPSFAFAAGLCDTLVPVPARIEMSPSVSQTQ